MDLAGIEIEIDAFDGVNAAIDLAAVDDPQHGLAVVRRGSPAFLAAMQLRSSQISRLKSRRPAPRAAITCLAASRRPR